MNRLSITLLIALSLFVSASAAWASNETETASHATNEEEIKSLIHVAEGIPSSPNPYPYKPNPCHTCHTQFIPQGPMPDDEAHKGLAK